MKNYGEILLRKLAMYKSWSLKMGHTVPQQRGMNFPVENGWGTPMARPMGDLQDPIDWRHRFHICLTYFSGLCKGISPQFMAKNMLLT